MDLVDGIGMQQERIGVTIIQNRCHRNDTIAYDIAESALLTIDTSTLFPAGIPRDFSILVVAKPKIGKYHHPHPDRIIFLTIPVLIRSFDRKIRVSSCHAVRHLQRQRRGTVGVIIGQ